MKPLGNASIVMIKITLYVRKKSISVFFNIGVLNKLIYKEKGLVANGLEVFNAYFLIYSE